MTPLRVLIVLDDPASPASHELKLLELICRDQRFHLAGLVQAKRSAPVPRRPFEIAIALEASVLAPREKRAAEEFEKARDRILVFGDADSAAYNLGGEADLVVDFSGTPSSGDFPVSPRFGVWRLTSSDRWSGFRQAVERAPTTAVELVCFTGDQSSGRTIAVAHYNTKFSASRNAAFIRENSVSLIARELARVSLTGRLQDGSSPSPAASALTLADLAIYCFRLAGALAERFWRLAAARLGLRPGMWTLRIAKGSPFEFDAKAAQEITPTGNSFWADPFLIQESGKTYLYFEEFDYATSRGHISVGEIVGDDFKLIGIALKTAYHLSFPFVFSHAGSIYMLPETIGSRRLELWRAASFPTRWELHATALDGAVCADTAIVEWDDAWWLFTNLAEDKHGDHCSDLHLFRMDGPLLENLIPHPLNPVVIDSRTGRGAGRVFRKGGKLYRLSQNNQRGDYGYGVNIMEIIRLDMDGFEERIVRTIDPEFDSSLMGCHHMDFIDDLVVIDTCRKLGGFDRR